LGLAGYLCFFWVTLFLGVGDLEWGFVKGVGLDFRS